MFIAACNPEVHPNV